MGAAVALLLAGLLLVVFHVLYGLSHGPTVVNENRAVLGLTNYEWSRVAVVWMALAAIGVVGLHRAHRGRASAVATALVLTGLALTAGAAWYFDLFVPATLALVLGLLVLGTTIVATGRPARWAGATAIVAVVAWLPFALATDAVYVFRISPAGVAVHGDDLIAAGFGLAWGALGLALLRAPRALGRAPHEPDPVRASQGLSTTTGDRRLAARLGVVTGATAGIAVTVPFAVAFHSAYRSVADSGVVLARVGPWLDEHGFLNGDSGAVYDRYGVAYTVSMCLVTASLAVLVRPLRGARRVGLVGLVVLCAGLAGDYAVADDTIGAVGFACEGLGLLLVVVGAALLARERAGARAGVATALGMLACMVAGAAATGHVPSGPGLTALAGALWLALRHHAHGAGPSGTKGWRRDRRAVRVGASGD